ncbi:replication protein A 70 kDa DNA-binding subunit B-like [Henckelia pumila]|uniref:replication protein A 70 kDa DNA-binding subunit B-like n=1 Tax=Henckelia pumila TaxID=405737 RepID=UPI003C6EA39E
MINNLQENQSDIVIEALVLRQGSETKAKKSMTTIRKVILMDKQGTMIYAFIFSNVIPQIKTLLQTNTTYFICNLLVRPINSTYVNVNPKFDLTIQAGSVVTETQVMKLTMPLAIEFKSHANKMPADLIGFVKNVRNLHTFRRPLTGTIGYLREIVLMNEQYDVITVGFWDDMALNEAQLMKNRETQWQIVAICNLTMQTQNVSQLKSTPTTYVILDPPCPTAAQMTAWFNASHVLDRVDTIWTNRKFAETDDIKLEEIIKQRSTLTENNYYCVRGTIKEIENNLSLLYNACNHCHKAATKTQIGLSCLSCTNVPVEFVPRYRLTVLIEDGTGVARITMFGHIVESFISHPVEEFIKIRNQNIDDVIPHNKENHRFLFKLDWSVTIDGNMVAMIAENFQKPSPPNSNSSQTKRHRRLIKGKINNANNELSKSSSSSSSFSKIDNPGGSEAHNTSTEIEDDEFLADYTKRIKRRTTSSNKKPTTPRKIKERKL